jgi:transposase
MGKPHPIELRSRVVAFVEDGHSNREASRHFRVSSRFVNNRSSSKPKQARLQRAVRAMALAGVSLPRMLRLSASAWTRTVI